MNEQLQYTLSGQHPDDAIFEVKTFINKLEKVQHDHFEKLVKDLQLTEEGESWLFDYVYNASEEEKYLTFDEYLSFYKKTLKDFVEYK